MLCGYHPSERLQDENCWAHLMSATFQIVKTLGLKCFTWPQGIVRLGQISPSPPVAQPACPSGMNSLLQVEGSSSTVLQAASGFCSAKPRRPLSNPRTKEKKTKTSRGLHRLKCGKNNGESLLIRRGNGLLVFQFNEELAPQLPFPALLGTLCHSHRNPVPARSGCSTYVGPNLKESPSRISVGCGKRPPKKRRY